MTSVSGLADHPEIAQTSQYKRVTRDLSQRVVCHYRPTRTGPFGRAGSQMPTALNWQNNFRVACHPSTI